MARLKIHRDKTLEAQEQYKISLRDARDGNRKLLAGRKRAHADRLAFTLARVEAFAQTVADEVEGEHGERDCDAGKD